MSTETRAILTLCMTAFFTAGAVEGLSAQGGDDCQLEGTEVTRQAEKLIDEGVNEESESKAQRNFEDALKRIQLALKADSEDASAYWLAGRAHLGLEEYATADSMFARFTALKPGCTDLANQARFQAWVELYNSGIRRYQAGDDSAALERFEKANVIYEDARSLNNEANVNMQRGNLDRAASLFRRSMKVAQDSQQLRVANINLAEILRTQGKKEEALEIYSNYIENHPKATLAKINFAVTLRSVGQTDSANAVFDELLSRDDLSFEDWYRVGINLMQGNAYQKAQRAFAKGREINPYDKATMESLMNARMGAGAYQSAMALADTLARWYPYQTDLYRTIAQGLDRLGQPKRVQDWLRTMQGLEVEIPLVRLIRRPDGSYRIRGQVSPRSVANRQVTIPFEFLDREGNVMMRQDATLQLPGSNAAARFEFAVSSDEPIAGFRYKRVQGGS